MNEISIQDRYRLYGMLIKDDICFMIEKAIKRLPVMDVESRFYDYNCNKYYVYYKSECRDQVLKMIYPHEMEKRQQIFFLRGNEGKI